MIGPGEADEGLESLAHEVGRLLARAGCTVVCGGLGGVMQAACRGAKSVGGLTVGVLPGPSRSEANPYVDVAIATGIGEARNAVVVRSADAVVAVGGGLGTLSEIALALRAGKPVVGVDTWQAAAGGREAPVVRAGSAAEAVRLVLTARSTGAARSS